MITHIASPKATTAYPSPPSTQKVESFNATATYRPVFVEGHSDLAIVGVPARHLSASSYLNLWGRLAVDNGTHVVERIDLTPLLESTHIDWIDFVAPAQPIVQPTRMARIRKLANLSLRDWASVFGVSHTAIRGWTEEDPEGREALSLVLGALEEASRHHPNLSLWLQAPIPGMDIRPFDLLRDGRWRAFRGAIRARPAPPVELTPEALVELREASESWSVPEPPIVTGE